MADATEAPTAREIACEACHATSEPAGNAILVCHALTGDQYVASQHPITGKPGWWARMVGHHNFRCSTWGHYRAAKWP